MNRLIKDFDVVQALENDDAVSDSLLDFKNFYRKHAIFEDFFTNMKDAIIK